MSRLLAHSANDRAATLKGGCIFIFPLLQVQCAALHFYFFKIQHAEQKQLEKETKEELEKK